MSELKVNQPLCTIKYRSQVKKVFYFVIGASLFSLLVIFRLRIDEINGQDWYRALFTLIFASSLPLTLLFKSLFVFRPKIFCHFDVFHNKLVRRWGKSEHVINFEDLVEVRFSKFSPRFFGGFTVKSKSGQELHFPSLVENCSEMVEAIAKARPDLIDEEKAKSFLMLNQALDISWTRIREKFQNWKFWVPKYVVWPVIQAWFLSRINLDFLTWFYIVLAYSYLFAFFINHAEEKVWLKRISQSPELKRDFEFEKRVSAVADGLYYVTTALLTVLLRSLF